MKAVDLDDIEDIDAGILDALDADDFKPLPNLPEVPTYDFSVTPVRRGWEPTAEEIRAACLAIQATWSDEDRARRACRGVRPEAWRVPGAVFCGVRRDDE